MKITKLSYFQVLYNLLDEIKIKHKKDCIIKNEYFKYFGQQRFHLGIDF